jgi:hypothetical protein
MSECLDYWEPTLGAMEVIVECLPAETRRRIREKLQLTAKAQAYRGYESASYFSRALSGEPCPSLTPKPRLVIVK